MDEKKVFGGIESSDFKVKDVTISPERMKLGTTGYQAVWLCFNITSSGAKISTC